MFTFIHAADIHLDSPLRGLAQYEGAPVDEIRSATRRAFENLITLAIDRQVDFVLIAGDLYDGDWRDHNTGLHFLSQMSKLREAGIEVIIIRGNHDAENKMTKSLRLPENVQMLSHNQVQTASSPKLRQLGVVVHGRSFSEPAEYSNLALAYPEKQPGAFNIGLLHTSLSGAEGHAPYAPCTVADLRAKGYDYWALGHIHDRRIVCEEPPIVFPGNIQGRHIRETGSKGCYVVSVDDRGRPDMEFQALDVMRWEHCHVDATGCDSGEDVLETFGEELRNVLQQHPHMPLALRVTVCGRCAAHDQMLANPDEWQNQFRGTAIDVGAGRVWIEKLQLRTATTRDLNQLAAASGPIGELIDYLAELRQRDELLVELAADLNGLWRKLPEDLKTGEEALAFDDATQLREILDEVEPLLVARLSEGPVA